jgi:hypothetical protein
VLDRIHSSEATWEAPENGSPSELGGGEHGPSMGPDSLGQVPPVGPQAPAGRVPPELF